MSFNDNLMGAIPSDHLEPPTEADADTIELTFRVKIDREGLADYYAKFGRRDWTPAETLIREAIAAWESETIATGEGRRTA